MSVKFATSLLLAGLSAFAAATSATAADFPTKARPVEYVKICSLYGAGYYYIPGTDICMKVGGYVRLQGEWQTGGGGFSPGSTNLIAGGGSSTIGEGRFARDAGADFNFTTRAVVSTETRQQTAYGTLRTYFSFGIDTPTADPSGTPSTVFFADRSFIQLAGFTAGIAQSFFDIFSYTNLMSYSEGRTTGDTKTFGAQVFAYTWMIGNGASLSLSAENPVSHNRAGVVDGSSGAWATNGVTTTDNAKNIMPDLIAALRVDQSWGYAGVSGAVHQVAGGYYGGVPTGDTTLAGHPDDKYGWAASVGGLLNLPWGDRLGANFVYTEGAAGYATNAGSWQMYGQGGSTVGVGWLSDGIFDVNLAGQKLQIELTRVWSMNAAYEHFWTPNLRTSLYGGYVKVTYDSNAVVTINAHLPTPPGGGVACGQPVFGAVWPPPNVGAGVGNSCSPDFSFYQVGSRTQWTPVAGLDVGFDVFYTHLNTAYRGAVVSYPATGSRPTVDRLEDTGALSAIVRMQRSFVP